MGFQNQGRNGKFHKHTYEHLFLFYRTFLKDQVLPWEKKISAQPYLLMAKERYVFKNNAKLFYVLKTFTEHKLMDNSYKYATI